MRVAYVCADAGVPVFGTKGCTVHVQEIVRAFRRRGAQVTLFARREDGERPPDLRDLVVRRLPALPEGDIPARERAALAQNGALEDLLEDSGDFDLVYERYSLWSYAAMAYAMRKGIRGVLEVNAPLVEEQARHRGLFDRPGAEAVANRIFSLASCVIAVTAPVADYVRTFAPSQHCLHVVSNGVRPALYGRPRGHDHRGGEFVIGFVGTLKPWHGLDVLAAAFARLHRMASDARLRIVGDGPERESMRAQLDALGVLRHACFYGAVAPGEVPAHLADLHVAVAPYASAENFYFSPLKVYEYMAAGLPVVAGRVGELTGVIRDGQNGILCPPGDPEALADALNRLWRDPLLCARLGAAARETVVRSHTWDAVLDRILRVSGASQLPQATRAKA